MIFVVPRERIELPTRGFSVAVTSAAYPFLNSSRFTTWFPSPASCAFCMMLPAVSEALRKVSSAKCEYLAVMRPSECLRSFWTT